LSAWISPPWRSLSPRAAPGNAVALREESAQALATFGSKRRVFATATAPAT